jgi:hypothetical protein
LAHRILSFALGGNDERLQNATKVLPDQLTTNGSLFWRLKC